MDAVGSLRTLRRRWVLTLILLLLALAATALMAKRPGPYQSESQVVLLPSKQSATAYGGNPYLSFGTSITLAADLVRRELMNPLTVQALTSQGFLSSYEVVDDPDTTGPVLDVTVTGSSKSLVENTINGVTTELQIKLSRMQANVKPADRITSLVVSMDPHPSIKISQKARPIVAVLGLGLILTVVIPQLIDGAVPARRKSHSHQSPQPISADEGSRNSNHRSQVTAAEPIEMPNTRQPVGESRRVNARPARRHEQGQIQDSQWGYSPGLGDPGNIDPR
jgi:polysaccharide biosynthesis protein PslJ